MAVYEDMAELIGLVPIGTEVAVDEDVRYHQDMEDFLSQSKKKIYPRGRYARN